MSAVYEEVRPTQMQAGVKPGFHLQMAYASAALLIVSIVGCRLTSIRVADSAGRSLALLVALAIILPLPLYWQEKHRKALSDAAWTIPWALVIGSIFPFAVDAAARLNRPLLDAQLAHVDQLFSRFLGISVPGMVAWAGHHWLGNLINHSYAVLLPLLPAAFLAPALSGRVKRAQEFLRSNLIAFAIALPAFALLPAVGPWYGLHFAARPEQLLCQSQLMALRQPGLYLFQPAAIVCFPSFHVIWAILCARSLWDFRPLRIPVVVLSGMIILSTMTTGWHYFSDVVVGASLAVLSIMIAKAYAT